MNSHINSCWLLLEKTVQEPLKELVHSVRNSSTIAIAVAKHSSRRSLLIIPVTGAGGAASSVKNRVHSGH